MQCHRKKFSNIIGYFHHNKGDLALITAYCLGAQILEFHFTDDRSNKTFRDHKIFNKNETKNLIEKIKRIKKFIKRIYKTNF